MKTVIINFKTYKQGKSGLLLAKKINRVASKIPYSIVLGVQPTDVKEIKKIVSNKILVFAQHVDYQEQGRNTGFVLPEAIKADGARGTLLNHSEHPLSFSLIKKTIDRCKKLGLQTAVFAKDLSEARKIKKLNPNYLIYEPPALVSGKISVSQANPEIIKKFGIAVKNFLVGAGIHSAQDVETAEQFGASGIAISSAIVLSKDPGKKLLSLFK